MSFRVAATLNARRTSDAPPAHPMGKVERDAANAWHVRALPYRDIAPSAIDHAMANAGAELRWELMRARAGFL